MHLHIDEAWRFVLAAVEPGASAWLIENSQRGAALCRTRLVNHITAVQVYLSTLEVYSAQAMFQQGIQCCIESK